MAAAVRPAYVYAPLAVLVAVQVLLRPRWPGVQNLYDDWANFAYYSTYLLLGFVMARSPAFERALDGERRRALMIAAGTTLLLLAGVLGAQPFQRPVRCLETRAALERDVGVWVRGADRVVCPAPERPRMHDRVRR